MKRFRSAPIALAAPLFLLACSETPTSMPEGPAFSLASNGPTCAGRPATIYQDNSGMWVLPPGASATPLGGGGFTIVGTSGDDVIVGSPFRDVILPGDGNDVTCAGDGDDHVEDGNGNDRIFGENGNDWLYGAAGVDRIDGGNGNDRVVGGPGNDELFGGPGGDELFGFQPGFLPQPRDYANGGAGTDVCVAATTAACEK